MPNSQSILLISTAPEFYLKTQFHLELDQPQLDSMIVNSIKAIGIDSIREAIRFSRSLPVKSQRKNIVLLNAHTLTLEAQNACLKLLEEPPTYLDIFLTSPNPYLLIDTIQSRCQIIYDPKIKVEPLVNDSLTQLVSQALPNRINLLPSVINQESAMDFCQSLITSAHQILHLHPNPNSGYNLNLLLDCITHLKQNTNPTLTLTDTVLQLK